MTNDSTPMHAELTAFFDTHAQSTAQHKASAHEQINGALDVAHEIQRHLMTLEHQLRKALTAPHDHAIDHNLNALRTRIRSTGDACKTFLTAAEDVAARMVELEDAFSESTRGINGLAAVRAGEGVSTLELETQSTVAS